MWMEEGIYHVLESTNQSGSKMTAALASCGNGRMGDGILKLMACSEKTGIIKGSLITGSVASILIFSSNLYMWRQIKRVERSNERILNALYNEATVQPGKSPSPTTNPVIEKRPTDLCTETTCT